MYKKRQGTRNTLYPASCLNLRLRESHLRAHVLHILFLKQGIVFYVIERFFSLWS